MQNDPGNAHSDASRDLLRHTVSTLELSRKQGISWCALRLRGVSRFRNILRTRGNPRTLGDLFAWALSVAKGRQEWRDSPSLPWADGVKRFFAALEQFDACERPARYLQG